MRSYLVLLMCAGYLCQYFTEIGWLRYIVVVMALVAFLGSAPKADRLPRLLGLTMMITGMGLELLKGTGADGIADGLFLILPLVCLITLAPLLSIPLRFGGYFEAIARLLAKFINEPRMLFAGITGTLFFLSPVLNLGSVRIINDFFEELKLPSMMSAKSYLVGFTTAVFWSPYFASVSLVLHYLDVPFKAYIGYGLAMSVLSLLLGQILFAVWDRRHPVTKEATTTVPLSREVRRKLVSLIGFIMAMMAACLVIEGLTHWSMLVIVCLLSIVIPAMFAFSKANWVKMKPLLLDYRDRTVPMMNNELMLFMSAGMLAFAVKGTPLAHGLNAGLVDLAELSLFLFALAVIVMVLVITYIGIHQIAVVGALAMQLNPVELGISNISLALLLLLAWSVSTALSPFSGLNLMVSRFAGMSGVQTGLNANGIHMSLISLIGIVIITIVG